MGFNQKINDSMNNMSRSVTTQMMKDAPPDLKYVYIGPVDEKTRPFCLDAAAQGALTEAQILELGGEYAESLVSGGGINCRHNWELASDDIQSQFHRGEEAKDIMIGNLPKSKDNIYKGFKDSNIATMEYVKTISEDVEDSIRKYTWDTYGAINSYMRGGTTFGYGVNELRKEIRNIKRFAKNAPKVDATLYRRTSWMSTEKKQYKEVRDFFLNNSEFRTKQFMSTSTQLQKDFAISPNGFAIDFKITGSKTGINIDSLSSFNQKEILLMDGTKFKIKSTRFSLDLKASSNMKWSERLLVELEEI